MNNDDAIGTWEGEGGALTKAERDEAGLTAVAQEQGLTHLPPAIMTAIHVYDVAVDAGVETQAPGVVAA
jgi:hypothetical protein